MTEGVGWIHGSGDGDLIRDGVGGGDVDRGRLPCEGGGAGVVVVVSLPDRTAEGEVAWESAAAISPCITTRRRQQRREARGRGTGETFPTSCVVDMFPVENAGKRAAIPRLVGFQRHYRLSQGSLPPQISRTGN